MRTRIKVVAVIVILATVVGVGYYALASKRNHNNALIADSVSSWKFPGTATKFPSTGSVEGRDLVYSDIRDPGGIPQGLPVRLKIPVIGVDSAIEDALITPDGRMDVPAGSVNVAWFSLGTKPGDVGSAVIGGHFGIRNGVAFVFYKLDMLTVGDKVYIENDKGDTLAFVVRSVSLFKREDDATSVFTSTDGVAHLNLITCEGIWNRVNNTYPERRVIFADAVPSEAAISIAPVSLHTITKAEDIATFPRSFSMGASGMDVIALQIILQQKGLLIIPPGVVYGFFGPLTKVAVANYQISVGLPPVGVFGPLTKAKILAELGGDTGLPNTGENLSSQNLSGSSSTIVRVVKRLYGTSKDALITALLLLMILFMAFKIARRYL